MTDELVAIEAKLDRLEELLEGLLSAKRVEEREFLSVEEVAALVGPSPFQVRAWARDGRIRAEKAAEGRGPHQAWRIPRAALVEYRNRGLRTAAGGR
ncbi:helix-turn-helix domain-containing protein [Paludisphaera soli]|uniref:helix-turn-helix domain-containing protein n=1 Tax=Paludisphaera soli TaxID=2712865 RepID=UPI0013EADEEC|nr:helix-turn-helix domain-containing protein [Paludisphaera soli]